MKTTKPMTATKRALLMALTADYRRTIRFGYGARPTIMMKVNPEAAASEVERAPRGCSIQMCRELAAEGLLEREGVALQAAWFKATYAAWKLVRPESC